MSAFSNQTILRRSYNTFFKGRLRKVRLARTTLSDISAKKGWGGATHINVRIQLYADISFAQFRLTQRPEKPHSSMQRMIDWVYRYLKRDKGLTLISLRT